MFKPKIAIFGASGFVGSALVERLFFDKGYDFKALIHSFGNAAQLARLPLTLAPVDVLDFNQINKALAGCNVVVNCSRGNTQTMIKGLKNIIKASKHNKIEKFIHIGSIAIYGSNPPAESSSETATPNPGTNSYGAMKLKQDEMIFDLHVSGIPSMILCPSNISGPYSVFVLGAVEKLFSNEIVLVDDGKYPTNLIHVDNLVAAILTAIESDKGWGERYFINEIEKTTWKEFFEELKEMLGLNIELESVSRDEVLQEMEKTKRKSSFASNIGHLMSRDVRNALSVFPAFKKFDEFASNTFFALNPDMQKKLRQKLKGPTIITKETNKRNLENPYIKVQVRQVFHSPEKIISKINYTPFLDYQHRRESTESWLNFINIATR